MLKGRKVNRRALPETVFLQGDNLLLIGDPEKAAELAAEYHLQPKQVSDDRRKRKLLFQAVGMVEVMLPPGSSLIGHSLKKLHFQSIFNCLVLAIRRKGEPITSAFEELPLQFGDVLLVSADWKNIIKLADYRDRFLLLDGTAFSSPLRSQRVSIGRQDQPRLVQTITTLMHQLKNCPHHLLGGQEDLMEKQFAEQLLLSIRSLSGEKIKIPNRWAVAGKAEQLMR